MSALNIRDGRFPLHGPVLSPCTEKLRDLQMTPEWIWGKKDRKRIALVQWPVVLDRTLQPVGMDTSTFDGHMCGDGALWWRWGGRGIIVQVRTRDRDAQVAGCM